MDGEKAPAKNTRLLGESAWPAGRQAWYMVALLTLVFTMAELDRGVITLLVTPIKRDLHLSDVQMSYLLGFAFVFFQMFVGIPLSRLVDSGNRRNLIILGLTAWSLMSAMCGLAQNYWQLFLSRIGIGAGES